jgi:ubiquinone/menaquinone biosynthesis C-methylase UbiE
MNEFPTKAGSLEAEADRIRSAYARRNDGDRYSWFNPGNLFMLQERERVILNLLEIHGFNPLTNKIILDMGCGFGYWIREFIKWGASPENITGIDLSPESISTAKARSSSGVKFICGSAVNLELPDAAFDLVVQSTVFTSILDQEMKQRIAREMVRVLKPDGLILWYDFHVNNPNNADVRAVKKKEIYSLFPDFTIEFYRINLAPPIVRALAPISFIVCYLLEKISILNTHYIGILRR